MLDELTGWRGRYDTPVGRKLVGEMVRRDVNHPSVLVWDNGNEGGWNNALNDEFAKWDLQQRIVMHPRSTDRGVNDPHYPDYAAIGRQSGGPAVYFPTEFLHGLYDGGSGSGFHDYWEVLRKSQVLGGAFFWVMYDDGVVRTDKSKSTGTASKLPRNLRPSSPTPLKKWGGPTPGHYLSQRDNRLKK